MVAVQMGKGDTYSCILLIQLFQFLVALCYTRIKNMVLFENCFYIDMHTQKNPICSNGMYTPH